jgi:hypothetical protein
MLVQLNNAYAKKILLTQEAVDFENELIKREKEKAESMARIKKKMDRDIQEKKIESVKSQKLDDARLE